MLYSIIVVLLLCNEYNDAQRLIGTHIVNLIKLFFFVSYELNRYFVTENDHQVISIEQILMILIFGQMVLVN
jgi:hypothetical protein